MKKEMCYFCPVKLMEKRMDPGLPEGGLTFANFNLAAQNENEITTPPQRTALINPPMNCTQCSPAIYHVLLRKSN